MESRIVDQIHNKVSGYVTSVGYRSVFPVVCVNTLVRGVGFEPTKAFAIRS